MSFNLPFGVKTLNPAYVAFWEGPYTGSDAVTAKAAALDIIPEAIRVIGMDVKLVYGGATHLYWFKNGTTDGDLVPFETSVLSETDPTVPSHVKAITTTNISNWNEAFSWGDHDLVGYLLASTAAATYIPLSQKGASLGVAPLNAMSKIDTAYLPDSVLGNVSWQGNWNATTDTPTLPAPALSNKGHYYIVQTAGTYNSIDFGVGDWVISNGLAWEKVDNTDAVISFNGRIGPITLTSLDVTGALGYTPLNPNGLASEYIRGNGTFATFPTLVSQFTNDAGYLNQSQTDALYSVLGHTHTFASLTSKPTSIAGYGITDAYTMSQIDNFFGGVTPVTGYNKMQWDDAYSNRITSLTTTGDSGAATLINNVLNIPTYTLSGLGGVSGSGVAGRVAIWNGASSQTSDSVFVWDSTNKRLGVNVATPSANLDVLGSIGATSIIYVLSSNTAKFGLYSSGQPTYEMWSEAGRFLLRRNSTTDMVLTNAGRFLFGTTTDNDTDLLQVNGRAFVNSSLGVGQAADPTLSVGAVGLNVFFTSNQSQNYQSAIRGINNVVLTGSGAGTINYALSFINQKSGNFGGGTMLGAVISNYVFGTGNIDNAVSQRVYPISFRDNTTNLAQAATGFEVMAPDTPFGGTHTIVNLQGLLIQNIGVGFATNSYAIKIENQGTGANNWAIHSSGGKSYHAGRFLIGSPGDDGVNIIQVSGSAFISGNLGIGISNPTAQFHLRNSGAVIGLVESTSASGASAFQAKNNSGVTYEMGVWGSARASYGAILANEAYLFGSSNVSLVTEGIIKFGAGTGANEKARINNAGRFLLGTQTDNGTDLLQVNGSASIATTLSVGPTLAGASGVLGFVVNGAYGGIRLNRTSANDEPYIMLTNNTANSGFQLRGLDAGGLRFTNVSSATEYARFNSSGIFLIGMASGNGTDLLQVNGSVSSVGAIKAGANSLITGSDRVLELRGAGGGANSLIRFSNATEARWSIGFNNGNFIIYDDYIGSHRFTVHSSGFSFAGLLSSNSMAGTGNRIAQLDLNGVLTRGSIDPASIVLTSQLGAYLLLTGGTLTGPLNGTSAAFSGVTINNNTGGLVMNRTAVTNYVGTYLQTAGNFRWFVGMRENLSQDNYVVYNEVLGADAFRITSSDSAAIFSSSVTATNFIGPGTGLTGTASGLSIGGNAATATNSTQWNGMNYSGSVITSGTPTYIMGWDGSTWRPSNAGPVQSFLGLGSMAYASTGNYYTGSAADARYAYVGGGNASGTWGINITGNSATATNLSTNRTNWSSNGTISAVVGQLSWKHYGNSHTIFDASNSTAPDGTSVSNTNAAVPWGAQYPTLMGWNGSATYGVRVDSARIADSASSVAWTNVSSRPTNLSQFTNDLGNYGGWITGINASMVNAVGNITNNTSGTSASAPLLSALSSYVFNASTNGRDFAFGIQASFVSSSEGYPDYGSVVRVNTYSNDGGSAELYFPYSVTYGGGAMRYRLGQYPNAGWSGWKTVIDNTNYNSYSPTLTGGGASGTWGISITGSAGSASISNQVTVNYNNDSNSTYQMIWGSGNSIYGTAGIYCNPNSDTLYASNFIGNWNGYTYSASGGAYTMVQRDSNGYIINSYFYTSSGGAERNGSGLGYIAGFNSSDYYIRSYTMGALQGALGLGSYAYRSSGLAELSGATFSGSITATEIYTGGWFRNNASNQGLYNQAVANHFYANSATDWVIASTGSTAALQFRTGSHQGPLRGYVYADTSNQIGFLNSGGSWSLRVDNSGNTFASGNIYPSAQGSYYLYQANSGLWTNGNFGASGDLYLGTRGNWLSTYLNQAVQTGSDVVHNTLTASTWLRSNGQVYIDANYGYGIVGLYSSTRFQGVFAMGDSYKLPADGTSTGSLYGLAWSHPNAGGQAANLSSHGLLVIQNGSTMAAISTNIWAANHVIANNDIYLGVRGVYLSSWLNQSVQTGANVTFNQVTATNGGFNSDINDKFKLDRSIKDILSLRGLTYERISTGKKEYGYIAQEVELYLPEAVYQTDKGLAVSYHMVNVARIDAIQTETDKLKEEVKKLKEQVVLLGGVI